MQDAGQRSPGFVLDLLSLAGSVPNDNNAPRIDFQEVGSLRHWPRPSVSDTPYALRPLFVGGRGFVQVRN